MSENKLLIQIRNKKKFDLFENIKNIADDKECSKNAISLYKYVVNKEIKSEHIDEVLVGLSNASYVLSMENKMANITCTANFESKEAAKMFLAINAYVSKISLQDMPLEIKYDGETGVTVRTKNRRRHQEEKNFYGKDTALEMTENVLKNKAMLLNKTLFENTVATLGATGIINRNGESKNFKNIDDKIDQKFKEKGFLFVRRNFFDKNIGFKLSEYSKAIINASISQTGLNKIMGLSMDTSEDFKPINVVNIINKISENKQYRKRSSRLKVAS